MIGNNNISRSRVEGIGKREARIKERRKKFN